MKKIIKWFKLFYYRKQYDNALDYITENFNVYQVNKDEPAKSSFISLHLYKHQQRILRHLITFKRLLLVKSKSIGGTLTTSAYLIYLCLTRNNQNIFICASDNKELALIKAQIFGILSQIKNFGIQGSEFGADFQNNSQITFITESDLKKYKESILILKNVTIYFDNINGCQCLSIGELKSFLVNDDINCIISATSTITPTIEWLWYKHKTKNIKPFEILTINAYKIKFSRKQKGAQ